jgi:hypothetical protein
MNDAAQARQATTGTSINDTIKQLNGVARKNPSNFEGVAATQARDGLTDLFHTTTPVSAPPGFNAASAQADAAAANSQFKNAEFLQGAQRDVFKYGDNVGPAVKAYNEKWYGQDNSPVNDALMNLYKTQQQSGAVPRYMTAIAHEGIGGLLGEGLGHAAGLPLGIGAGLGMIGTYGVAKPMLGAARGLSQGIDTQQACSASASGSAAKRQSTRACRKAGSRSHTGARRYKTRRRRARKQSRVSFVGSPKWPCSAAGVLRQALPRGAGGPGQ